MKEQLQHKRYGLKGQVMREVSKLQPLAPGALKTKAVDAALLQLLGPDTGDDKERHKKDLEAERRKKKQAAEAHAEPPAEWVSGGRGGRVFSEF